MASAVTADVKAAVDAVFREEWGRVVATLIRTTGDWDLAEECAQEAFAEALRRWPIDGIPRRPGAWLTTVAGNRAIDALRRSARGAELLEQAGRETAPYDTHEEAMPEPSDGTHEIEDDRFVAGGGEDVENVRADESRAARDQNPHSTASASVSSSAGR